MRRPLLALGLAVSSGLGAIPVTSALATTPGTSLTGSTTFSSTQSRSVSGAQIVQTAMRYLGYRYTATGNSPSTGFSCIGFASYVYRSNGIPLPGDLGGALAYAPRVAFANLEPGDLVFFQNTWWPGLSHVGIYIGGGRFVHAESPQTGVVVSPLSEPYYATRYLAANRPWNGASVGTTVSTPPKAPSNGASTPGVTASTHVPANAPSRIVSAKSGLNLRSAPSKSSSVMQVLPNGTTVYILGKSNGWYKVELPDGTIGWVSAVGITGGGNVGSVTAPVAKQKVSHPTRTYGTVSVLATGLRVHASPSLSAPVVSSAARGQKLVVLSRKNGWVKVRLPDGSVGWVSAAYVSGGGQTATTASAAVKTSSTKTVRAATKTSAVRTVYGKTAKVGTNVRTNPSLSAAIITVLPPGGKYRVLGWSNGWAHIQLANGTSGWISGTVLGKTTVKTAGSKTTSTRRSTTKRSFTGATLTAGVRVHSKPGVKSPVVGLAAAGTHVKVLGSVVGWTHLHTPTGLTGYVLSTYVR